MKKFCFLGVIVLLCVSTQLWGQDVTQKGGYVGIGASYAVENFDVDNANGRSYDNAFGLNVRVGYDVKQWLSLEFDFDYLSEFTFSSTQLSTVPTSEPPATAPTITDRDLTLTTYMMMAKLFPLSDFKTMKPYLTAGAGIMRMDNVAKESYHGHFSVKNSWSETEACARLGLGIDFAVNDNVTVGVEGSHVWGFGDLDQLGYFNLTLGAAYHF